MLAVGGSGKTTLTGDTIGGTATAQLIVRSDGTTDQNQDGAVTQINSGTDWIVPNAAAPGPYSVRFTLTSGDTPGVGTLDTWLALTSDRNIGYASEVSAMSSEILAEISPNVGTTISASGTYNIGVTG